MVDKNDRESQSRALLLAVEAAAKKDVQLFLKHLYESRYMDGATRWLQNTWGLDNETIHNILSDASDKFYARIASGGKVLSPGAYLFKVIKHLTADYYESDKSFVEYADERRYDTQLADRMRSEIDEQERESRRKRGIEIARSLLPKIGQENVQRVMSYIIDAVEAGVEDISNREIAEALGLSEVSVRKWKERGFKRMKRAAIEAGYRGDIFSKIVEAHAAEGDDDLDD